MLACLAPAATNAQPYADEWLARPVDDRTFRTFLDFFTFDSKVPFDLQTLGRDEQEGIKRERLSFQSTPGIRVFAHLYEPPESGTTRPATIVNLHGGGPLGKQGAGTVRQSVNLARAGWRVLAIDLQYFGERSTGLLTTFTEQEKHDRLYNQPPVYLAWVAQSVKDVARSIDLLIAERGADAKRIGLIGFSRGAILVPIITAIDKRVSAAVALSGGHFDALDRVHVAAACPANYIGRITPRPLLMLAGSYDKDMIKETSVDPLYRLANQPKQILWSEGGHGAPSEQNQALMVRWLRENLK